MALIECVPNFSEGRDRTVILAAAEAASLIQGATVIDYSLDYDHNRSVLTFIGKPRLVVEAAIAASERALALIDMRQHQGVHPRIGAVDVVPFIPLTETTMDDAVTAAHDFGRRFAERNNVPVFYYGEAARFPERRRLATIRRGEYEDLPRRLVDPAWRPDEGPVRFNPASGTTAVGARKPLVAFNINLNTDNLALAQDIARSIRQSSGGLNHVQAIGIPLASRSIVQVSMNLTDCDVTPIVTVFERVRRDAASYGVTVLESEIVGLIPEAALAGTTPEHCMISNFRQECILEHHFQNEGGTGFPRNRTPRRRIDSSDKW